MIIQSIMFFRLKVIFVKLMKDIALMSMGAGALLAYQKYNKPVINKMQRLLKNKSNELENMMSSKSPN